MTVKLLLTLGDPMNCSPPGSYVHGNLQARTVGVGCHSLLQGILQARTLEWVAIPFSRGSSQPRDRIWVSSIAGRLFTI